MTDLTKMSLDQWDSLIIQSRVQQLKNRIKELNYEVAYLERELHKRDYSARAPIVITSPMDLSERQVAL